MNYAKGLVAARTHAGLTRRRLADRADLDASYITHIESGRKRPSLDVLERLAEALEIPVPVLVLLSADPDDLVGISPSLAASLGDGLLGILHALKEGSP